MRDRDDPLLAVLRILEGKRRESADMGLKLEAFFDSLVSNIYLTAYMVFSLFLVLTLLSHILIASENDSLRSVGALMHVGAGFTRICHQLPYRSFIFDGIPMAVCSRDTGIYLGFIIGALTFTIEKPPRIFYSIKLPFLASLPIALDGVSQTILVLRESNNLIRLATGFFFALGLTAYLVHRFFLRRYPEFRKQVCDWRFLTFDSAFALVTAYLILLGAAKALDVEYMSRQDAVGEALEKTSIDEPSTVKAFYVSSATPLSASLDPYYSRHRDVVLDDIRDSGWVRDMADGYGQDNEVTQLTNQTDAKAIIEEIAEKQHRMGIWAIAILEGEYVVAEAPYIRQGSGEYLYFDPVTGEMLMQKHH